MTLQRITTSLPKLIIPEPSRPKMPEGYGVPASLEGTLSWEWVQTRMREALVYWIGTLHPAGRPHLMPNWGVWIDDYAVFSTSPETRKARNLAENSLVSIGVQEGQHGVVIEGKAVLASDPDLLRRADDEYERKYHMREEADAMYVVLPHKVIALSDFPMTPTRWVFKGSDE